ncbi:hypothetical protein ASPSYDRAFT_202669, partial [Aspergillus sydowii CBS 593.65]
MLWRCGCCVLSSSRSSPGGYNSLCFLMLMLLILIIISIDSPDTLFTNSDSVQNECLLK